MDVGTGGAGLCWFCRANTAFGSNNFINEYGGLCQGSRLCVGMARFRRLSLMHECSILWVVDLKDYWAGIRGEMSRELCWLPELPCTFIRPSMKPSISLCNLRNYPDVKLLNFDSSTYCAACHLLVDKGSLRQISGQICGS